MGTERKLLAASKPQPRISGPFKRPCANGGWKSYCPVGIFCRRPQSRRRGGAQCRYIVPVVQDLGKDKAAFKAIEHALCLPLFPLTCAEGITIRPPAYQEPCVSMRKTQAARVLQEFSLSLKGAGSVDQHLRAVFARSKDSCGGGQLLDEVVKASRTFLKSLGSLGRRERGPWCSHNFDLVWWEAQNLTGSLFRPWPYHIPLLC